jgi:hypothetical protein
LSESEFDSLVKLYSELLMKYRDKFVTYKQARKKADKILMPDELSETEQMFSDLAARIKTSQYDLDELLRTESARTVVLRNISSLEAALEAMDRMTELLNVRIKQAHTGKPKS